MEVIDKREVQLKSPNMEREGLICSLVYKASCKVYSHKVSRYTPFVRCLAKIKETEKGSRRGIDMYNCDRYQICENGSHTIDIKPFQLYAFDLKFGKLTLLTWF